MPFSDGATGAFAPPAEARLRRTRLHPAAGRRAAPPTRQTRRASFSSSVPPRWISRSDRLLSAHRSRHLGGHGRGARGSTTAGVGRHRRQELNLPHLVRSLPLSGGHLLVADKLPRMRDWCVDAPDPARRRRRQPRDRRPGARLRASCLPDVAPVVGRRQGLAVAAVPLPAPRGLLDASRRFDHRRPGGFAAQCGVPAADERVDDASGRGPAPRPPRRGRARARREWARAANASRRSTCAWVALMICSSRRGNHRARAADASSWASTASSTRMACSIARRKRWIARRIVSSSGSSSRAGSWPSGSRCGKSRAGSRLSVTTPFSRTRAAESQSICDAGRMSGAT